MDNDTTVVDLTTPASKQTPLRQKLEKALVVTAVASAAILVLNDQVKRFSRKKHVAVVVADKDES